MTKKLEIYKCLECGNIVQILEQGTGKLLCCDKDMQLLNPRKQEDDNLIGEKHTPQITKTKSGFYITLSKHPMLKEHYIQFIEAYIEDKNELIIKFLKAEDKPEIEVLTNSSSIESYELCNIHGLWKAE